MADSESPTIALTGASGFVGRTLIPALGAGGGQLRCISRHPDRIRGPLPGNAVRVRADLLDRASTAQALRGADVAYYLVHSLDERSDFPDLEARMARCFADEAAQAGLRRIVYLGALAQIESDSPSSHIESRHRVGEILRASGVPLTELRASVAIGAGSLPFEVVRALVERLPVMITPRWVSMPIQPIAARDLVDYLVVAGGERGSASHVYEIGGSRACTYEEILREYARARGLRRILVQVPVVTPRLSSLWLRLVTPAHYRMGRRVVESAEHRSVVEDASACAAFGIRPMPLAEAIRVALEDERAGLRMLDLDDDGDEPVQKLRSGTHLLERRRMGVRASREAAYDLVTRIGGETGWFFANWLWALRGALDRLVGGPGLRRGGERQVPPRPGGRVDFWSVARIEPGDRLTLRADMRLPGQAWLDLRVRERGGGVVIQQTALFDARGLLGLLYWYASKPIHDLVFDGMLRGMRERLSIDPEPTSTEPPRPRA
jgi:uncharacterized protein YbjT (DUF2867 family)